jgi:exopolysaccharide biosynthesis polyprenyl glycosylphosphotransferase
LKTDKIIETTSPEESGTASRLRPEASSRREDISVRPAFMVELPYPPSGLVVPREEPAKKATTASLPLVAHFAHSAIASPVTVWALLDMITAAVAAYVSHGLSPVYQPQDYAAWMHYNPMMIGGVHALALFVASYAIGLYNRQNFNSPTRLLYLSVAANLAALAGTTLFYSWFRLVPIGRYVLLFTFLFCTAGTLLYRQITRVFAGWSKVRVLFVGDPSKFERLRQTMVKEYGGLYAEPDYLDLTHLPQRDRARAVLSHYSEHVPDVVVVEDDADLIMELLHSSAVIFRTGSTVRGLSSFHQDLLHEMPIDAMQSHDLISVSWGLGSNGTEKPKRVFDVVAAAVGLLLAAPILALVAIALRMSSSGPLLYRQTRVGRFGETFEILKFRTMRVDAEADGPVWARENDDRVTPLGRFLRRSRLDELPQLWNILKGEMSFVGPRPERPEFVQSLERDIPFYQLRHLVPPGLTGWAQIRYPYGASVTDARRKLGFDLYYVRNYGLRFDLGICLKTAVAMARGSR